MGFHSLTYEELKKNVGSKITKNKTNKNPLGVII
jgi:hypothetical protein